METANLLPSTHTFNLVNIKEMLNAKYACSDEVLEFPQLWVSAVYGGFSPYWKEIVPDFNLENVR